MALSIASGGRIIHPESTATARRVARPRDAACLVLTRGSARDPEVLMGRRRTGMAFMPNVYVFPGGKVMSADYRARPATPLDPGIVGHLAVSGRAARARALAMAAVRETFEETGLMLGQPGDVGPRLSGTWLALKNLGLAPKLDGLRYVARAITPTTSPLRFHARFFMADAAGVVGDLGGSGELLDTRWLPLSQVLDLNLAVVTAFIVREVRSLLTEAPATPSVPAIFTHRAWGPQIRYG